MSSFIPFVSSNMRIFVDNQEIVAGTYGSGIATMGDIDIAFVDHIEIYSQNPTYEYSTEPTTMLIKLYTKKAEIDEGSSVSAQIDNYTGSIFRTYDTHQLKDFSYFAYASVSNRKRKKYYSHDQKLSRDIKDGVLVASIKKDDTNVLILGRFQDRDMFMADVLDASPTDSTIQSDSLHIGIDSKINDNFSYLLAYDYLRNNSYVEDDLSAIKTKKVESISHVFSSELKYTLNTDKNKLITGIKFRLKKYYFPKIILSNINIESTQNDTQSISTIFLENQYNYNSNSILTTGISLSNVYNNSSKQDDNLLMYRVGYTHTNNNIIVKTIYSYLENSLDAYLINSTTYLAYPNQKYKLQKQYTFAQDIIYEKNKDRYEMLFSFGNATNFLLPSSVDGKLITYDKDIPLYSSTIRYTHKYRKYDKFFLSGEFLKIKNLPNDYLDKDFRSFNFIIRNINKFDKFDIFNQASLNVNNYNNEHYFDYDIGIKYHYSNDLTISFKGENIFNNAKEMVFKRIDLNTGTEENPLQISAIDQRFLLNMEYKF